MPVSLARALADFNHCLYIKRPISSYPAWCFTAGLE